MRPSKLTEASLIHTPQNREKTTEKKIKKKQKQICSEETV